jgi:hypothetical protein
VGRIGLPPRVCILSTKQDILFCYGTNYSIANEPQAANSFIHFKQKKDREKKKKKKKELKK